MEKIEKNFYAEKVWHLFDYSTNANWYFEFFDKVDVDEVSSTETPYLKNKVFDYYLSGTDGKSSMHSLLKNVNDEDFIRIKFELMNDSLEEMLPIMHQIIDSMEFENVTWESNNNLDSTEEEVEEDNSLGAMNEKYSALVTKELDGQYFKSVIVPDRKGLEVDHYTSGNGEAYVIKIYDHRNELSPNNPIPPILDGTKEKGYITLTIRIDETSPRKYIWEESMIRDFYNPISVSFLDVDENNPADFTEIDPNKVPALKTQELDTYISASDDQETAYTLLKKVNENKQLQIFFMLNNEIKEEMLPIIHEIIGSMERR